MVNPYDSCIANKDMGDDEQLTVIWHVDNLMGSCKIDFELTKLLCYLAKIFGLKLTIHRRKHNYLGVDLNSMKMKVWRHLW